MNHLKRYLNKHLYYILFQVITLVIFVYYSNFKDAGLNDGDSITHYYISRYAWHYPHLFLDNWGKPFFILLSSSFAQFGYGGIQFFNVLCAVISSWFCYRIADKLGIKWAAAAPVFLIFTPVYLEAIPSGLTEILFGLVFITAAYLLVINKYSWAALLISFLPFCRTEGLLIMPVFGLFMLLKRKFVPIPLMLSGFIIYSCIGYFYYGDFLWIMHTNPYRSSDVYGHGTLDYFFRSRSQIFSDYLSVLFASGVVYIIFSALISIRKHAFESMKIFETLVILGSFVVYFSAHSIFWYKGLFGSAGMLRVMAGIAPAFVLISMRGFDLVLSFFRKIKWLRFSVGLCLIVALFVQAIPRIPQYLYEGKRAVRSSCDWVKQNHLDTRKIYYSEPFTKMCLSLDPYDTVRSKELMFVDRKDVGVDMKPKSIIIWEPGLGPREDGIPLAALKDTSKFVLLNKFEAPNDMAGNEKYTVYVFERK